MRDHPRNPTLIVGLGAFGREVLNLSIRGPVGPIPNLGRIEITLAPPGRPGPQEAAFAQPSSPPPPSNAQEHGPARVIAAAEDLAQAVLPPALTRLRALLDLAHYVDHTDPTDPRGPRCDVFLLGDLAEPGVAEVIAPLAAALASGIRGEFQSILRTGDGALSVCPLLSAPREADAAAVAGAARALLGVAESADSQERLGARVYMVEDQSGKYLLSRAELVRSFAAFLHLLLFSGLRDDEAGARGLVERASGAPGGPFATFACATLELDHASLARLCAVKLAREVLTCFLEGASPTITEVATLGASLVPHRSRLENDLWQEGSAGSLEKHLEPPAVDVPEIAWEDSPEDIVERKFSPLFRARAAARMRAFREDVERFKMDRLALEIEKSGKACLERALGELAEGVQREVEAGPRGYARALEILRDALARARGLKGDVEAEIESPDLSPFPSSPFEAGLAAIHEAAASRPRVYRMVLFGGLGALLSMVLIAGVILAGYRSLVAPDPSFFDLSAPPPEGFARAFAAWPMPFVIGALLGSSSTYYRLWKHYKRHHNWAVEARDSLDQALKGYLCRDVVSYFYRRLHYTRLLWVQRIYRSITERIEEAIATLEGARAAIAEADQKLAREQRALEGRLEAEGDRGGVLFRGLLTRGDASAIYAEIRPANVEAMAERFLRESLRREPWTAAPFADTGALLTTCSKELAQLDAICPFKPDSEALFRRASDALKAFLQKLALKLSPPLATADIHGITAPRPRYIAVVPPEAEPLIRDILAEGNLRGAWDVRGLSKDARRVHLLIERGDLELKALRIGIDAGPLMAPAPIAASLDTGAVGGQKRRLEGSEREGGKPT